MRRTAGDLDGCGAKQDWMGLVEGALGAGCDENWNGGEWGGGGSISIWH